MSHGTLTVLSPTGCRATPLPVSAPPSPLCSAHSKAGSVSLLPKWMSHQGKECPSPSCRTPLVSPGCSLEVPPPSLEASHLRGKAKSFSLGTPSPSHKASTDCPRDQVQAGIQGLTLPKLSILNPSHLPSPSTLGSLLSPPFAPPIFPSSFFL